MSDGDEVELQVETTPWNSKPINVFKLLVKQYAHTPTQSQTWNHLMYLLVIQLIRPHAYTISNLNVKLKHEIKQDAHTQTQ